MRLFLVALTVILASSPARADVFPFNTPSGNIECSIGTREAEADIECTIHERSGPPAKPKPAGCSGGWGYRFSMRARGVVTSECGRPDPGEMSGGNALPYDDTVRLGGFVCLSTKSGLNCRNADGHGFFLSRRQQSVF